MRARHRHFNAKDVGASGVYDARFISGLANNASVSTWNSRTGTNNATQGTAANQPIYKTNQFNGNPVVEFDGTNDGLTFSKLDASAAWALCVVKRTSTNTYQNLLLIQNVAQTIHTFLVVVHNDPNYGPVLCGSGGGGSSLMAKGSSLRNNQWRSIYAAWLGGGSSGSSFYRAWDDGASFTLTNSAVVGASALTTSFIATNGSGWGGQIALIVFGLQSYSDTLRKRVSHAAAYSFKLASS